MSFVPISRSNDPKWRTVESGPEQSEVLADFVNPSTGEPVGASEGYAIPTEYAPASSGLSVTEGELVRLDGSNNIVVPSAPFTTFLGVAQHTWTSGVAPSDLVTEVAYTPPKQTLVGNNPTVRIRFRTIDVNGVSPLAAHVGSTVQIVDDVTNGWGIDVALTTSGHVTIVDILQPFDQFVVEFVDSAIQAAA